MFADDRFIAVGKFHYEVVGGRVPRCSFDLFPSCVGAAITDICGDGVVKQSDFLTDQGDVLKQGCSGHVTDILAVDKNGARIDIIEARNQI